VNGRVSRRIRALGLAGFEEYLAYLDRDRSGRELSALLDVMTTNVTSFFREPAHFQFLKDQVAPDTLRAGRKLTVWSAGCSNGAEPYSIAMTLRESAPATTRVDAHILATDISTGMLEQVKAAVYPVEVLRRMDPNLLQRYFTAKPGEPPAYEVRQDLRAMVRAEHLNLLHTWPGWTPFDVIFCRNVMIYFDRATRVELVRRFTERLRPGGYLLVGHSESLTGMQTDLQYVMPAVYRKPPAAARNVA